MRLYAGLGRREAALRQYQLCVDALKRELGAQPEAETTQLYQEIVRSRPVRPDRAEAPGLWRRSRAGADRRPLCAAAAALPEALPPTNLPAPTSELIGRDGRARGGDGAARRPPARHADRGGGHRQDAAGPGGRATAAAGLHRRSVARRAGAALGSQRWCRSPSRSRSGSRCPAGAESPERVAAALGARRLLLVLDNCEHVIDAAAHMAEALLRADPHARVLATSREPLRAPGEYVYRVASLEVPREDADDREASAPDGRGQAVRRAGARGGRPLLAGRAQRGDHGRGLSTPRRDPAGDRAGGGPDRHARGGRARGPARRSVPAAHGGPPHGAARASRRCGRPSTGATSCSRRSSGRSCTGWPSSPAGSRWRRRAPSRRPTASTRPEVVDSVTNLAAKSLVAVEVDGADHAIPAARDDAGLRAREARRQRRARPGGPPPRRILPGPLRAGRGRAGARPTLEWLAVYGRQIDNVRTALDWAFSPTRRRVDRGGAHRRGGATLVPAVAPGRVPRPRRARAGQPRASPGAGHAPRDAALRRAPGVAHAHEGGGARHHRGLDHRPRDRRGPRRHRVSAAGPLGPVAFPHQPRRVPRGAGAGGDLLGPGGRHRQSGRSAPSASG